MKFALAILGAILVASPSVSAIKLAESDPKTGMAIPVCNGTSDDCVTADAVSTHDKKSHGYKEDHEWSHS